MKDIEWKIIWTITLLVLIGLMLILFGHWIGIVIGSVGILAFAAGWKEFSASPLKVGALTHWGKLIKTGKEVRDAEGRVVEDTRKTVTVRGKVVLAPYFPFFIDAVEIDMTKQEWAFDVTVYSVEGLDSTGKPKSVPVPTQILLTVAPNEDHLNSFIQSGGDLTKIKPLMEGIAYREVQRLVKTSLGGDNNLPGLNYMEIVQQGDLISKKLEEHINGTSDRKGVFEDKSFGVVCKKVQIKASIPDSIDQSMVNAASIVYETDARATEYKGDIEAAAKFRSDLGLDGPTAWNCAVQSRLMRDEAIQRVQIENLGVGHASGSPGSSGVIQPIVVSGLNVNMGKNNKNSKKGKDNE